MRSIPSIRSAERSRGPSPRVTVFGLLAAIALAVAARAAVATPQPSPTPPALTAVLGRAFAPDGSILPADRAVRFGLREPILLSLEVREVAAGTVVRVVWRDRGGRVVASARERVIGGEPFLFFRLPRPEAFPVGRGTCEVEWGSERLRLEFIRGDG